MHGSQKLVADFTQTYVFLKVSHISAIFWWFNRLPCILDASGSRVIASDHLPKDLTIVSCPFGLAITQPVAQRAVLESLQIPTSENIQWSERQWISTYISLHWIIPSEDINR